jgi:hypothetical protein
MKAVLFLHRTAVAFLLGVATTQWTKRLDGDAILLLILSMAVLLSHQMVMDKSARRRQAHHRRLWLAQSGQYTRAQIGNQAPES